jgi:hypothetical protein
MTNWLNFDPPPIESRVDLKTPQAITCKADLCVRPVLPTYKECNSFICK